MRVLELLSKKWYIRFFLLWFTATGGYVLLQEALPKMIGAVVGAIYRTGLGMTILDSVVLDFIFSAAIWCFYAGILLAFLIMIFVSFFHALLNSFAIFEKYFDFLDTLRASLRLFPFIAALALIVTILAAMTGTLERIIPSPFSSSFLTNFLFSLLVSLAAFFTTANIISSSVKDAALNTARLIREYWPSFLLLLLSCTILISLLGWILFAKASQSIWFQLLLSATGFLLYGLISGFLFDFFIRNKDPFLLNSQSPQQLL